MTERPPDSKITDPTLAAGAALPVDHRSVFAWLVVIVAALAAWLLIYGPVRDFDFLNFDDDMFLSNNPLLKQGLSWTGIQWAFLADLPGHFSSNAEYWSPITLLSRLFDAEVYGLDSGAFHATSALIHLFNSALLGIALFRLTNARWHSAVVAFLFLVHPLNVEPVCWLSARKDLLGATFFFVTLLAYAHYARRASLGRYILLLLSFCAALMAKPMAVTIPLILLLLDWWPLGRWRSVSGNPRSWGRLAIEKLPIFLLAVAGAYLAIFSQRNWGAMQSTTGFPMPVRINNALVAYVVYLRRLVWPNDLAIYYPHPGHSLPFYCGAIAAAILVVLSIGAFLLRRRAPYLLMGWLWFGVVLGPVIGLVQIGNQAMADRYAYTSVIGIFIAVVWAAAHLLRNQPRIGIGAAVLAICAFTTVSARQVLTWRNSETVFTQALAVTKANDIAHLNLGNVYYNRGEFPTARNEYLQSLAINPTHYRVLNNLGIVEAKLGEDDSAIGHLEKALEIDPAERSSRMALASLLVKHGREKDAESLLRVAVAAEPGWAAPYAALGRLYAGQKKWPAAAAMWSAYLRIHPEDPAAREALAAAQASANYPQK